MDIAQKRALALRAVDCPGWEDRPGMLNLQGYRVTDEDVERGRVGRCGLPDFDDDATRGCLFGLVRKAWNDPHAWVGPYDGRYEVNLWDDDLRAEVGGGVVGRGATEIDAMVAALEAAAKTKPSSDTRG